MGLGSTTRREANASIWLVAYRIAVAALLLHAGAASAQVTAYAGSAQPNVTLSIFLKASVGQRCGIGESLGASLSVALVAPDLDVAGIDQSVSFTLNCNTAARVAVVSDHGGFVADTGSAPGFTNLAPYDVELTLVGDDGEARAVCGAADLRPGATSCAPTYLIPAGGNFAGPASVTSGLRLAGPALAGRQSTLRVKAGAWRGPGLLVAGRYADTLTLTVSPAS